MIVAYRSNRKQIPGDLNKYLWSWMNERSLCSNPSVLCFSVFIFLLKMRIWSHHLCPSAHCLPLAVGWLHSPSRTWQPSDDHSSFLALLLMEKSFGYTCHTRPQIKQGQNWDLLMCSLGHFWGWLTWPFHLLCVLRWFRPQAQMSKSDHFTVAKSSGRSCQCQKCQEPLSVATESPHPCLTPSRKSLKPLTKWR